MLTVSRASQRVVTIQLVDDRILENPESFTVRLFSSDPRVSLQQNEANVSISDDDSKT